MSGRAGWPACRARPGCQPAARRARGVSGTFGGLGAWRRSARLAGSGFAWELARAQLCRDTVKRGPASATGRRGSSAPLLSGVPPAAPACPCSPGAGRLSLGKGRVPLASGPLWCFKVPSVPPTLPPHHVLSSLLCWEPSPAQPRAGRPVDARMPFFLPSPRGRFPGSGPLLFVLISCLFVFLFILPSATQGTRPPSGRKHCCSFSRGCA